MEFITETRLNGNNINRNNNCTNILIQCYVTRTICSVVQNNLCNYIIKYFSNKVFKVPLKSEY